MKHNDANRSPDDINFALNVNICKRETTLRLIKRGFYLIGEWTGADR